MALPTPMQHKTDDENGKSALMTNRTHAAGRIARFDQVDVRIVFTRIAFILCKRQVAAAHTQQSVVGRCRTVCRTDQSLHNWIGHRQQ